MLKEKKINCPKCEGTVFLHRDEYGPFISCIQCGWCRDLTPGPALPKVADHVEGLIYPTVVDGCNISPSCFDCPLPDCIWESGMTRATYGRDRQVLAEYQKHAHLGVAAATELAAQALGITSRTVYRVRKREEERAA
jgi:hypothetical protein